MSHSRIQRALISVSDKTGIIDFARALAQQNIQILSTGGTASLLRAHQIDVQDVADYTQFPEIMDGRVKTLHPKVHGGLLGRVEHDLEIMEQHAITPIDLLVVNLYPFTEVIQDPQCTLDNAIENIDIGGPTMIRAGAKNYQRVTVVTDHNDYGRVLEELATHKGRTRESLRFELATKAFAMTANFDCAIMHYLGDIQKNPIAFPPQLSLLYTKKFDLRYGENPHQQAAFYSELNVRQNCIATAQLLQGKPLSYNNIADSDAALECVREFEDTACVIVKHANPCGVALADDQLTAYLQAFKCDSTSAFGGIIAFNTSLSARTAQKIIDNQFVEVIIAPELDDKSHNILAQKPNIRVLVCGELTRERNYQLHLQKVNGGILVQERDNQLYHEQDWQVVTKAKPSKSQIRDLQFAWRVAKFVKSNAIVYAKDLTTIGIGAGQMSRIDSTKIAGTKAQEAGLTLHEAVMASDAFFPFRDAVDSAAAAKIRAIIQPGGSIRDDEVISAANEAGIVMVFTGMRHFRH